MDIEAVRTKVLELKVQLAQMPGYAELNHRRPSFRRRVETERELGRLASLVEQHEIADKMRVTREKIHERSLIRLDYLDDLSLIRIASCFSLARDVKALYNALNHVERLRVENEFCIILTSIWSKDHDNQMLKTCSGPNYCHRPTLCLRCYLNCKSFCITCNQKATVDFEIQGLAQGCKRTVQTSLGSSCLCKNLAVCPNCNHTYDRVAAIQQMVLVSDFNCECVDKGTVGCPRCMRTCWHCLNVGCKTHFRSLSFPTAQLVDSMNKIKEWEWCEECESHHCCRTRYDALSGWDYCACPIYENRKQSPSKKLKATGEQCLSKSSLGCWERIKKMFE